MPASASSTPSSISHQSGLSTATKAEIGIGAALGALALLTLSLYLIFRKRRGRRSQTDDLSKSSSMESKSNGAGFAELPDQDVPFSELADIDARKPVEMGIRDSVHELETRYRG